MPKKPDPSEEEADNFGDDLVGGLAEVDEMLELREVEDDEHDSRLDDISDIKLDHDASAGHLKLNKSLPLLE